MDLMTELAAIELAANERGEAIQDVLNRAGVNLSTWRRWRQGVTMPRLGSLMAIREAANGKRRDGFAVYSDDRRARVYFMRFDWDRPDHSPVKIGRSISPKSRALQIASQHPWPVIVMADVPGTWALERNVQDCFADLHMHGEWFSPAPRLLNAIERIVNGTPLHVAVDLNDRRGNTLGNTHRVSMIRSRAAKLQNVAVA